MEHIPVLKEEVIKALDPKPNAKYIDATLGFGGHSKAILEKGGEVLGLERDPQVYNLVEKEKIRGLKPVNASYLHLKEVAQEYGFSKVEGILFDLGFNSWQIEKSKRGFTFKQNEPLDMRYNPKETDLTAEKIVNTYEEKDLVKLLKKNSQEKFAKAIAREIIEQRPLKTTFELVGAIERAVSSRLKSRIHPATRTFQALRIEVNDEFNVLKQGLEQALSLLKKEGRLAVISFHSKEERIIKNLLKIKKPILPTKAEIALNKRARSAKLWLLKL